MDRSGKPNVVPRIIAIRRKHPVQVRDVQFLRANTESQNQMTVPGAFTMAQQAQNIFYKDEEEMIADYAAAVNEEIMDLFAAGAGIVQVDEPYMQARPDKARKYAVRALAARWTESPVSRRSSASATPPLCMSGPQALLISSRARRDPRRSNLD